MTSLTQWRCRNDACPSRPVLGVVRDGVLSVEAFHCVFISQHGVARVQCPTCGDWRVWAPNTAMPPSSTRATL